MPLWNFIEQYLFPLFGDISPYALERVRDIFWIVLGCCIVYFLVYMPFKGLLCLMKKAKWKEKWLL